MHKSMRHRMQHVLGVVALLTGLGLVVVACGGGKANEGEAGKKTPAGGQQGAQVDLPPFPPAPRDAEDSRLRLPGDLNNHEDLLEWVITDSAAKWQANFAEAGVPYSTVYYDLYDQSIDACESILDQTSGPLYCFSDNTIYFPTQWVDLDTGGLMESYGDFAMAIVAAHEVGHHVQLQLGMLEGQYPTRKTELQADCFAGVWGYSVISRVQPGDVGEAMEISWDSGDLPGTLKNMPGAHGKPEERVKWFRTGYDSGDADECFALTPLPQETTSPETTVGG